MFLQQLNTIATVYFSKFINTGDKLLDNTIISICVILCSSSLLNIVSNWKRYINCALFWTYRMYRDPLKVKNVPYIYDYSAFQSIDDFRQKTRGSLVHLNELIIEQHLRERGSNARISYNDMSPIIMKFIQDNNIHPMLDKDDNYLRSIDNDDIIYPLTVSRSGAMVYFLHSMCSLVTTTSHRDAIYVCDGLEKYIVEAILTDSIKISTEDIFVSEYKEDERRYDLKSIGKVNKKKTFDALFYPQKTELVNLLTKFKAGKMYPEHIPIDNKLGILLYGPPGTGKTGTISAVANMLRRSILVINFAEIKTCKQLDEVMNPKNCSKYVYVFDEFDCVLDVISGNHDREKKSDSQDWGKMLMAAEGDERKAILKMMREGRGKHTDSPIDLAHLLQKLDGLESAQHRIIVATTNNPDKINPALLRPGRFDIKICLGLCTSTMIVDILTNFYQGDASMRQQIAAASMPENTYSALQLINMAIQARDLPSLLATLKTAPSPDLNITV
jgi:DNA polymerase III delta prime subunit